MKTASSSMAIIDAKTVIQHARAVRTSASHHQAAPEMAAGSPDFEQFMQAIDNHLNYRPTKSWSFTPGLAYSAAAATATTAPGQQHQSRATTAKRTLRFSTESYTTSSSTYYSASSSTQDHHHHHHHQQEFDVDSAIMTDDDDEEEEEELVIAAQPGWRRGGNGVSFAHSSPPLHRQQPGGRAPAPSAASTTTATTTAPRGAGSFLSRFDAVSHEQPAASGRFAVAPPTVSFASRFGGGGVDEEEEEADVAAAAAAAGGDSSESLLTRFSAASVTTTTVAAPVEVEDTTDADAEFARQLMEAEEQEFLERLHSEQARALAQLRGGGDAGGGESWLNNISAEDDAEQQGGEGEEEEDDEEEEMSYERLLELGDQLGDVKTERWREKSTLVLASFTQAKFSSVPAKYRGTDMCVICQFAFEQDDDVKLMPNCTHCFHPECTDAWIKDHSSCATCKASVE